MLRAENLALRLHGRTLLEPLSLTFAPGALHAVFGPNGAGKSTLLRLLAREWRPSAGRVSLDDRLLQDWPAAGLARRRAMLPQQHALTFPFAAEEVVALGRLHSLRRSAADEKRIVAEALAAAGATAYAARSYAALSGGERARVQLARVLAQIWDLEEPRYLLLDEPTAHLDLAFQHACLRLAREWSRRDVCVIAVLHDPNLVLAYADTVCVLDRGALVTQGTPATVLTPALVMRLFALPAERLQAPSGQPWLAIRADAPRLDGP